MQLGLHVHSIIRLLGPISQLLLIDEHGTASGHSLSMTPQHHQLSCCVCPDDEVREDDGAGVEHQQRKDGHPRHSLGRLHDAHEQLVKRLDHLQQAHDA